MLTSSLSNLSNGLLHRSPPVLAKHLLARKLVHLRVFALSPQAATSIFVCSEDNRGQGTVANNARHASSCLFESPVSRLAFPVNSKSKTRTANTENRASNEATNGGVVMVILLAEVCGGDAGELVGTTDGGESGDDAAVLGKDSPGADIGSFQRGFDGGSKQTTAAHHQAAVDTGMEGILRLVVVAIPSRRHVAGTVVNLWGGGGIIW